MTLESTKPGILSSLHTTPASSSWVQSLLPQPRDLQNSMLFSPPLHSTLSSQIFPEKVAECQCTHRPAAGSPQAAEDSGGLNRYRISKVNETWPANSSLKQQRWPLPWPLPYLALWVHPVADTKPSWRQSTLAFAIEKSSSQIVPHSPL